MWNQQISPESQIIILFSTLCSSVKNTLFKQLERDVNKCISTHEESWRFKLFPPTIKVYRIQETYFLFLKLNCSQSERKVAVIVQRPLKEHALLSHLPRPSSIPSSWAPEIPRHALLLFNRTCCSTETRAEKCFETHSGNFNLKSLT